MGDGGLKALAQESVRSNFEALYRRSYGRLLPRLIRLADDFGHGEDALQQAFGAGWKAWGEGLWPDNPEAWLWRVAQRRLVDGVRRRGLGLDVALGETELEVQESMLAFDEGLGFEDDCLRLIFMCCHPALAREAQVALTLNSLCGLSAAEIGSAFLVSTSTMAQRLVRVKQKIRATRIPFRVPPSALLAERLPGVLSVFYLVFTTGHSAPAGERLMRGELCEEALRLARLLLACMPGEPELEGLLALMLFQHGRRSARCDSSGKFVRLEDQDRSLWDRACLEDGQQLLLRALARGHPGNYQMQAAIAGVHAAAGSYAETDWLQILLLYDRLQLEHPNPVVELNRCVALAMVEGPAAALLLVDELSQHGELESYLYLHATRADFLQRLERNTEALVSWKRAFDLAENGAQREFLRGRIEALS